MKISKSILKFWESSREHNFRVMIAIKWKKYKHKLVDMLSKKVSAGNFTTNELVNVVYNFCEVYCGVTMFPYQKQYSKRIIKSVLENDAAELTALFARQMGKTEVVANTVGGLMIMLPKLANMPMFAGDKRLEMFKTGLWVGIFAPSLRQATTAYNRLKARLQSKSAMAILADKDFNLEFNTSNGQTVSLNNGSFVTCFSASPKSNIEGESFKLIICEECQDISDFKLKKSISPMGAAYNATMIKIGTATTFKGDFYEAIQRNIRNYNEKVIPIKDHYEYDYKVGIKYNPKYEKYIEKEKQKLGEFSDEFQMSYALKWILQRGMFIEISKFIDNNCDPSLPYVLQDKSKTHVVGIDLAKGDDSTVVAVVEVDWSSPAVYEENTTEDGEDTVFQAFDTKLKCWFEIFGDDYNEQYYEILDILAEFNVAKVVIDATKESSMADRLKANLRAEVVPYVFSSKSKSDLYKHFDGEIKAKRFLVPRAEETREYQLFLQQMSDLQKSYKGAYMVVAHPAVRGAHDDYPDATALAVWGAKGGGYDVTAIEVQTSNYFYSGKTNSNSVVLSRNRFTAKRR